MMNPSLTDTYLKQPVVHMRKPWVMGLTPPSKMILNTLPDGSFQEALKKKLDTVEQHNKRGLALHVPGCDDAEAGEDEPSCPEHCRACAFGSTTSLQ